MSLRRCVAALAVAFASSAPAAPARSVTLLFVSDLHAQLESHPDHRDAERGLALVGGFARVRTVLDRERARAPGAAFTIDGGSEFHGSGPAAWSRGEVVVRPLRALGIDVGIWGVADLAHGLRRYRELARGSAFPRLGDDEVAASEGFPRHMTFVRGGVRTTFVAVTSAVERRQDLRGVFAEVRRTERPDVLVAVLRGSAAASRWTARAVPGADVVLSSDDGGGPGLVAVEGTTVFARPGALGSSVARIELTVGSGGVVGRSGVLVPVRAASTREHRAVKRIVDAELSPFRARMRRVVGHTAMPIVRDDGVLETTADNLIADAIREATGSDVALADTTEAGVAPAVAIPPGPITEGQLWDLVPSDARIRSAWVTGKQLREHLEGKMADVFAADRWKPARAPRAAGLEVAVSASPPAGARRVWSVHVAAAPLRDFHAYTVTAFEAPGEPAGALSGMRDVQDLKVLPLTVHDALRRYLAEHSVVRPRKEQRVAATDLTTLARDF